ncbi:MAG: hypothetical protein JNM70_14530 [Anaerolineae bacterium]|nr:hypothetical protein [Anaerolineae bacterium]
MKPFFVRLACFSTPLVFTALAFVALVYHVGELTPHEEIIKRQMRGSLLYGPRSDGNNLHYKLLSIEMRRPEIIVLGSSRVVHMESGLFNRNPQAFFNVGNIEWGLHTLQAFVDQLDPAHAPAVAIVGIDLDWFSQMFLTDWQTTYSTGVDFDVDRLWLASTETARELIRGESIRDGVYRRLFSRVQPLCEDPALGIFAISRGIGFRSDGSLQRSPRSNDNDVNAEVRMAELARVQSGTDSYWTGQVLSPEVVSYLDRFLTTATAKGMFVIGYATPFNPEVYRVLSTDSRYEFFSQSAAAAARIFAQHDLPFFDFSNAADFGSSDTEFYDAMHPTALANVRLYSVLLDQVPDVLSAYSDGALLRQVIANSDTPYDPFGAIHCD